MSSRPRETPKGPSHTRRDGPTISGLSLREAYASPGKWSYQFLIWLIAAGCRIRPPSDASLATPPIANASQDAGREGDPHQDLFVFHASLLRSCRPLLLFSSKAERG